METEPKIRILQTAPGIRKGISGGIAAMLANYGIAGKLAVRYKIDYLTLCYQPMEPYQETLESFGSEFFCLGIRPKSGVDLVRQAYRDFKSFLSIRPYDIVHVNSGDPPIVLALCMAAKASGTKVVIAHSHNAVKESFRHELYYPILRRMIVSKSDYQFACSRVAAASMFSSKYAKTNRWFFIPNAINAEKYSYHEDVRKAYRKELGLQDDDFVIGHVGRFNTQKNHVFISKVFRKLAERDNHIFLLLAGTGELMEPIKKEMVETGLSERVFFLGQRKDVAGFLSAMDVFIFPSLWEGLGVSAVEAQANGLPCIISDRVPEEVKVSESVYYLPVEDSVNEWVDQVLRIRQAEHSRNNSVIGSIFDMNRSGEFLASLYDQFFKSKNS